MNYIKNLLILLCVMLSLVLTSGFIPLVTSIEFFQFILYSLLFGIHTVAGANLIGVEV